MINRQEIYYWKCDRPSAFYALQEGSRKIEVGLVEDLLLPILERHFGKSTHPLRPGGGQGNHLTFLAENDHVLRFVKVENGPEGDDFMEIEARVLAEVRTMGIPAPLVYRADATRVEVPFAYQVLEYLQFTDLNKHYKKGALNLLPIAKNVGKSVARWQAIKANGFGPFDPKVLREKNQLAGLHKTYRNYFLLNWDRHLDFLVERDFLAALEAEELRNIVGDNSKYLDMAEGCLVHKDLALWNILGTKSKIQAFVDWDDTISGDGTDDISLLACFHSWDVIHAVLNGYQEVRKLPKDFLPRFWLHLIRNMVVKAVIRVGANYFDRQSDFFLIESGSSGASLKEFTKQRIETAFLGLQKKKRIEDL